MIHYGHSRPILLLKNILEYYTLLSSRWGVILVLALYPPHADQHHQTRWILSTYTYLESISSHLCCGIIFHIFWLASSFGGTEMELLGCCHPSPDSFLVRAGLT
jgi:hypothetical protein